MAMIRSFIAVDLSTQILDQIEQISRQLKQRMAGAPVRWVPSQNMHLTLKFLGEVSEGNLKLFFDILEREAKRVNAFEIRVGGIGAFPSLIRPRVIWLGVEAPEALASLQRSIDLETARLGYAPENRSFSPHLTLGRVSRQASPPETRELGETLGKVKLDSLGYCLIDEVHFYRSDLSPDGARYTRLFSAHLRI